MFISKWTFNNGFFCPQLIQYRVSTPLCSITHLAPLLSPVGGAVRPPPHGLLHLGRPGASLLQLPEPQLLPALPVGPGSVAQSAQGPQAEASQPRRQQQRGAGAGGSSRGAGSLHEAVRGADAPVGPQAQAAQQAAPGGLTAIGQVGAGGVVHGEVE